MKIKLANDEQLSVCTLKDNVQGCLVIDADGKIEGYMASDAKIQKIYNAAGTDALDDKGLLYKPGQTGNYFVYNGNTYTFASGPTNNKYEYYTDSSHTEGLFYFISASDGGKVCHYHNGSTSSAIYTIAKNLNPLNGDNLGPTTPVTGIAFYPLITDVASVVYANFALESMPSRVIEASAAYVIGDLLSDNDKAYRCISAYTSATPPIALSTDTTHWIEIPVLALKADESKTVLTVRTGFSEWEYGALTVSDGDWFWTYVQPAYSNGVWTAEITNGPDFVTMTAQGGEDATSLSFTSEIGAAVTASGTATRTALQGYVLGTQTNKPLASEAEAEALRTAVEGKFDKTGGEVTGHISVTGQTAAVSVGGETSAAILTPARIAVVRPNGSSYTMYGLTFPEATGTIALAAGTGHEGNLAALDADGNPTDSGKKSTDFMAADAKVNHIYNTTGTDALDDKGGLFDSTIVQSKWTVPDGYDSQDIEYSYLSYVNGVYKWDSGWWKLGRLEYNANTGAITFIGIDSYGTTNTTNVATITKQLDPRKGDVLPNFDGKTLYIDNHWKSDMGLRFTATDIDLKSTPYAHLALESIPNREYSISSTYAVGDLVKYGNPAKAYRCNTAITTAESWNSEHWTEIPVVSQKEDVANKVTQLLSSSTDVQYPSAKCVYDAITANVKPLRIYNETGTDALDDKGQLYMAGEVGNYFTVNGEKYSYYNYSNGYYEYRNDLLTAHVDYQNSSGKVFIPTLIGYYTGEYAYIVATLLNPVNGDDLSPASPVEGWQFLKKENKNAAINYSNLAVESVPTRNIAIQTYYAVGDLLGDNGKAYRCKSAYTTPTSSPTLPSLDTAHWNEIPTLNGISATLGDIETALHTINYGSSN